jgi:site-specific recombinase XerD
MKLWVLDTDSLSLLERGNPKIQSYLGHNNIQHTVRYTELASTKFQGLWDG